MQELSLHGNEIKLFQKRNKTGIREAEIKKTTTQMCEIKKQQLRWRRDRAKASKQNKNKIFI
jgi:hypothetical protein